MTAPCTRCGRDCSGFCPDEMRVEIVLPPVRAEGTQPGTSKLVGQRVVVRYPHIHTRKGESPITETRHAFGRVTNILPDGALWVVTDREGGLRIEATNVEVVT